MQVKKPEVRDRILEAAFALFSAKGYAATTLPQIAAQAGVSTTNLYIYFDSKLALLYAVHGPWIQRRFEELEEEIAALPKPRDRLRRLFTVLFSELPAREGGFANNIMQGIAMARPEDAYRPTLLALLEEHLRAMVVRALPGLSEADLKEIGLAYFLMMAFDGYIVMHQVAPKGGCDPRTIEFLCDALEGYARRAKRKNRAPASGK